MSNKNINRVILHNGKSFETEDDIEIIIKKLETFNAFVYITQQGLYLNDHDFIEIMHESYDIVNDAQLQAEELHKFYSEESDRECYEATKYGHVRSNRKKKK